MSASQHLNPIAPCIILDFLRLTCKEKATKSKLSLSRKSHFFHKRRQQRANPPRCQWGRSNPGRRPWARANPILNTGEFSKFHHKNFRSTCKTLTKTSVHTVPMKSSSTLSSLFGIALPPYYIFVETTMTSSFGRGSYHCRSRWLTKASND